jgi:hypothetical protein
MESGPAAFQLTSTLLELPILDAVDFFWIGRLSITLLPADAVDVLRRGRWCLLDERVSGMAKKLEVI